MKKNKNIEQITKAISDSESFLLVTDNMFAMNGDCDEIAADLMAAILQSDAISKPFEELIPFFVGKGITHMREKALQMKMDRKLKVVAEPAKSELDIN